MEDLGLVGDLAIVAAAAVIGGAAARLLRLPAVIGYLAAGVAIGPYTPGPTGNIHQVQLVADLGVALLMFTLGIQFSLRELVRFKGLAVVGGLGVTAAMVGVGALAALALDVSLKHAVVVGMVVSLSSTMLALRLLEDRGLISETAGRIAIVVSLVGDMTVVVMMVLIPMLGTGDQNVPAELALALAKAVGLLTGIWVAGQFILPRILARLAESRSRELFLLMIVTLALGTASISAEAGLSVAFGAFLAGLLIAESQYAQRALREVLPLREVFAVVFFVAIGMLIDPASFRDEPALVLGIGAVSVFVKVVLITSAAVALGYPGRTALSAALALGSMGEFSFVLASHALNNDAISQSLNQALLASVLITIVVCPLLFAAERQIAGATQRLPVFGRHFRMDPASTATALRS